MNLKKRQLLTATLVIALAGAVLVNWYYNSSTDNYGGEEVIYNDESVTGYLGDSVLVAGTVEYTNESTTASTDEKSSKEYFAQAKLKRTQSNDEISDTIENILNETNFDQADTIRLENIYKGYCDVLKWQTDAENLIYAKTGLECVVIINSGACQVVVDKNALNDTVIFQITEIIEKNTDISLENLSIIEVK